MPTTVTPPATARPGDRVALVCLDTYAGRYELATVTAPRAADDREPIATVGRRIVQRDGSTVLELDWMRHEDAGRIGRRWPLALTVAETAEERAATLARIDAEDRADGADPTAEPTTPRTAHQARAAANANAYRDAVLRLAAADPQTMPAARASQLLMEQGRRERATAGRPVALADRRDGVEVATVAGLPPVPTPLPRTVDDARTLALAELRRIRVTLAEIAEAMGPETPEGHAAARAFHALPLALVAGWTD